jgi:hypothetical protein
MHSWQSLGTAIQVVNDTRDLGGHLSTQTVVNGSTITARLKKANALATKLAGTPWSLEAKQKIVETLVYPTGLYVCEASPVAQRETAKLGVNIAKAIGPYSQHSSNNLSFLIAKQGRDFSPTNTILQRSLALLRRILVKHPKARIIVAIIYEAYLQADKQGTELPYSKPACPPHGSGKRLPWKDARNTHRPIGLLLNRIHECGAFLNADLQALLYRTLQFDPVNCAQQHLRRHIADLVANCLSRSIMDSRSAYSQCGSIDLITYHNAMNRHDQADAITLKRLQSGGYWTDNQQGAHFEGQLETKCFHCGEIIEDVFHLRVCNGLKCHRREVDEQLDDADLMALPRHLLLGVPDHRTANLSGNLSPINHKGHGAKWDLDCLLDAAITISDEVKDAYEVTGIIEAELTTQQVAYKFLGYLGASPAPRIMRCDGRPPDQPNVYTDGSYLHPGLCLAYASFGSWEPARGH